MLPTFNKFVLNEAEKGPTFCYMLYLESPYTDEAKALQDALKAQELGHPIHPNLINDIRSRMSTELK